MNIAFPNTIVTLQLSTHPCSWKSISRLRTCSADCHWQIIYSRSKATKWIILSFLLWSHVKLVRLVYSKLKQTQKDNIVQSIVLHIQNGWIDPDTTKAKLYLTVKDLLTLNNELISKDLCVAIPATLRSEILNVLHQGHIGIDRTQLSARNIVYWPGINEYVTELIIECK